MLGIPDKIKNASEAYKFQFINKCKKRSNHFKTDISRLCKEKLDSFVVDCNIETNEQLGTCTNALIKERELHFQEISAIKKDFYKELQAFKDEQQLKFKNDLDALRCDLLSDTTKTTYASKTATPDISHASFTAYPPKAHSSAHSSFTTSSQHHTKLGAVPSRAITPRSSSSLGHHFSTNTININDRRNIAFSYQDEDFIL